MQEYFSSKSTMDELYKIRKNYDIYMDKEEVINFLPLLPLDFYKLTLIFSDIFILLCQKLYSSSFCVIPL